MIAARLNGSTGPGAGVIALLLFGMIGNAVALPPLVSCPLQRVSVDERNDTSTVDDFAHRDAVDRDCLCSPPLRGGMRICRCGRYSDRPEFRVVRDDAIVAAWPSNYGGEAFDVLRGDVDGTPGDEWIIAAHDGMSNGLGVSYWTLSMLSTLDATAPRYAWSTADYGDGSLLRSVRGAGCDALVTEWRGGDDPRRGPGTYFYGRRFALSQDGLAALDTPVRRRRLLDSFAAERWADRARAHSDYAAYPARWLSAPSTELSPAEGEARDSHAAPR